MRLSTKWGEVIMKTKAKTVYLWWVAVAVIFTAAVAATDWLTDGFTTVGPFVG